jgi:hypothetical protein
MCWTRLPYHALCKGDSSKEQMPLLRILRMPHCALPNIFLRILLSALHADLVVWLNLPHRFVPSLRLSGWRTPRECREKINGK